MTETTKEVAERRLEQEEREARDRRLAALQREETDRRDRERQEEERAATQEAARLEAERIAAERGALEDRADVEIAKLRETIDELLALDREHMRALSDSGRQLYPPSFRGIVERWTKDHLIRRARDARGLRGLDKLAADADGRDR